jgi:hypothetical protein
MRSKARPSGPDVASALVQYLCSVERAPQVSVIPDMQATREKIARRGAPCHHATTQRKRVSHSR